MVELSYAVELGLEVCRCTRTNMTCHTLDAGVWGVLVRHELRLHRQMAALAAKFDRLGISICRVTAERRQKKKHHSSERECREDPPITFARQVDLENAMFRFNLRSTTLRPSVQDRAEKYKCEAKKKEKRR